MLESRPSDAFQPGDLLNNTYRIEGLLGRGGTSDVYRARSDISGRLAALKVLKAEFSGNEDYLVLLTREEEIREIRHDAVVRYSENHRTPDGHVYLVMDYVEGPGLDKRLKQGPMSAQDLLTICRRVSEGLQAAHSRNIVHRDLSPDNIILQDGDPAKAVIIDFGIAKDTNPGAQTIVGNEFAGKYAYAAPEQLSGQTDARSDIYSLGALLLANFRGASPSIGKNPMEVVQKKGEPLDTDGVPEPLRTLIDRMTAPDPNARFQSADAVLAFLEAPQAGAEHEMDPDATVIMPLARQGTPEPTSRVPAPSQQPKPPPRPASPPPPAPPASRPRKSRGGLVAALLFLLVAGGGGGAYLAGLFDGLLGPAYPVAAPYTLIVTSPSEGPARAVGYVPSEQVLNKMNTFMNDRSGSADLTLATGDIAESWGADVLATLAVLAPPPGQEGHESLKEWRLAVSGNKAQLSGITTDPATYERVLAAFPDGLPGALEGKADIRLQPVFLTVAELMPIVEARADCGPLQLTGATEVGYGPDSPITITGRVAETATRIGLFDSLRTVAGERKVILKVEVLNSTLCLIENRLPKAPSSDIDVAFSFGLSSEDNPSGRFFVGENPVIDVTLPAEVTDGYLTVSILDVSGNVFHLLPNINREDNRVATLRNGQTGPAKVRVAFSLQESAKNGLLAFRVDDSTLGKSKVIVLHSAEPLFDGLRPTSESAEGYTRALQEYAESDASSILSLDSRILISTRP
jgi:eukaryotic-like serine/threonine-protein kinase